jgi:hypothetical protein
MNICVHTSPGRRGEPEPHVFFVGGNRLIVAGVLDRWDAHPHRYFEVRCDDGRRFLLRFDNDRRSWELAGVYAASLRPPRAQPASGAAPAAEAKRWWSALLRA